jgi:NADP-dependent 3-hydroxy acid dehydrogenase YdfG
MISAPRTDLAGSVVLVAGASSGMGRATAIAAAAAGAKLVIAARNADALNSVATEASTSGNPILVAPIDVTDRASVDALIRTALDEFGRIDTVVNTVGTNIRLRALDDLTLESWEGLIQVNLTSAFNLTQAVLAPMRRQGGGLIIHVSSSAAKRGDRSGVAYQATKAGLVGLAAGTMEEERQNGIRTTIIFPGLTDTPMVLKRPVPTPPEVLAQALQPEDVAAACLFVMRLPPRAHVPELLLYPSTL